MHSWQEWLDRKIIRFRDYKRTSFSLQLRSSISICSIHYALLRAINSLYRFEQNRSQCQQHSAASVLAVTRRKKSLLAFSCWSVTHNLSHIRDKYSFQVYATAIMPGIVRAAPPDSVYGATKCKLNCTNREEKLSRLPRFNLYEYTLVINFIRSNRVPIFGYRQSAFGFTGCVWSEARSVLLAENDNDNVAVARITTRTTWRIDYFETPPSIATNPG